MIDPCERCKTRSITFNGIHWTCSHCGVAVQSPMDAYKERVKAKLRETMSAETVESLLEGVE